MTLEPLLRDHPFLTGLEPEYLAAGWMRRKRPVP
jgi:hypothetical protein